MKYIISAWEWVVAFFIFIVFLLWFLVVAAIWPYKTFVVWVRKFLQFFFKALFIKVKLEGTENIDPNQNYLIMPNHVSMFDIPLLLGFIPFDFWGIQAASHFKVPLYGWVLKKYGNIPIDRSSPRASFKTMLDAVKIIKEGGSILILPEGTRTKTPPEMGPFKKLPFMMAKKAGVPILPIAFEGLWKINNITSKMIKPGSIRMIFGEPIEASVIAELSEVELRQLTRDRIQALLDS
jgi:1-acyl-sn-glycerol-3-phosphate acyltransferase